MSFIHLGRSSDSPLIKSLPIHSDSDVEFLINLTRITAAGTVPDSHRIPSHRDKNYPDYQNHDKGNNSLIKLAEFNHKSFSYKGL